MLRPPIAVPRAAAEAGGGASWRWRLCGWMAWVGLGVVPAAAGSLHSGTPAPALRVGYLAELPVSWRTGMADPLHSIARSLGKAFAGPLDPQFALPVDNLSGAASWEELAHLIRLGSAAGGAELFPMQGYELLQHERELSLKPLLLAHRSGTALTQFIILTHTTSGIQQLRDLEDRKILVHRDGCGYLVDYWLDSAVARATGQPRKGFARFQTVTQPREAVLPVFFGEVDACVVSLSAYHAVAMENLAQIRQNLFQLPEVESKALPTQVVACRMDLPIGEQRRVVETARHLTWAFGTESGTLGPAEDAAFDHLRALLAAPNRTQMVGPVADSPPTAARLRSSIPAASAVHRP